MNMRKIFSKRKFFYDQFITLCDVIKCTLDCGNCFVLSKHFVTIFRNKNKMFPVILVYNAFNPKPFISRVYTIHVFTYLAVTTCAAKPRNAAIDKIYDTKVEK